MRSAGESAVTALTDRPSSQSGLNTGAFARHRIRFTSNIAGPIFFVADLICLGLSVPLSLIAYRLFFADRLVTSVGIFAFSSAGATYLLIRASRHAYNRTLVNLFEHEADSVIDALAAVLIASALVWQFGMIENLSRGIAILFLLSFSALLLASRPIVRGAVRYLAGSGSIEQRIVFYGADPASIAMIRRIIELMDLPHLKYLGVADDRPKVKSVDGLKMIGGLDQVLELARQGELDQVLFCVPNMPPQRLHAIVEELSNVSVDVAVVPSEAIQLAPDYRVHLLGQLPVLTLWQRPFRDINGLVKRGEDLLIAGTATALLSPVMLIVGLLVKISSPGPVFFVQPRIGFNNELIRVLKFRTMFADRSDLKAEQTTTANDPRVTPIGRWLRRLSLDELPQLLNVIKGDMSLVGPRPHATHMKVGERYYQDAVRGYAGRHRVKPGITGLAQVKGVRGEIRTIERAKLRVEYDRKYIENWSVWLDLGILLATFRAVLYDADAY
ncbi:undecaprenyl-phosphate glucose phosphotransferase [Sphingomonas limnosediminicola]|uniref:Undecaprenyl-phosphate glucose phosphotransferase n=1 Tax=Sphingomonas limnosediminicola TaxID=940133 RepID=A0ABP7L2X7_9SPHN